MEGQIATRIAEVEDTEDDECISVDVWVELATLNRNGWMVVDEIPKLAVVQLPVHTMDVDR